MYIGNDAYDLGVCVPEKNRFVINTAIPLKKIGAGEISFHVSGMNESMFYPLDELDAFKAINKLQNAHLSDKNGKAGIMIINQSQGQQDSDPNP